MSISGRISYSMDYLAKCAMEIEVPHLLKIHRTPLTEIDEEEAEKSIARGKLADALEIADDRDHKKKPRERAEIIFKVLNNFKAATNNHQVETYLHKKIFEIYKLKTDPTQLLIRQRFFRDYAKNLMDGRNHWNLSQFGIENQDMPVNIPKDFVVNLTIAHIRDYRPLHPDTVKKWLAKTAEGFDLNIYQRSGCLPTRAGQNREVAEFEANGFSVGMASYQDPGAKQSKTLKEDFTAAGSFICQFKEETISCYYAVLCDGHGGQGCAKHITKILGSILQKQLEGKSLENDAEIFNTLRKVCILCDYTWMTSPEFTTGVGSTGCFIVRLNNALWCISTGDSTIALIQNNTIYQLSEEARVSTPKYANDATERGGLILYKSSESMPRLNTTLAMTKAYGNFWSYQVDKKVHVVKHYGLSAVGTVTKHMIDPRKEHCYAVLMSDGVTDYCSVPNAAKKVLELADNNYYPPGIAKGLVESIFSEYGAKDDTSATVVDLSLYK